MAWSEKNTLPLSAELESLLLAVSKPVAYKRLAEVLAINPAEVESALQNLQQTYKQNHSGFSLILNHQEAALVTNPELSQLVEKFVTQEEQGELTKPQLEALTVIAYRGPITKLELEQIRGVNCSLILRNLQIRGLVEELGEGTINPRYQLTTDCLRFLGINTVRELPNYETLSSHEIIQQAIKQTQNPTN
ncbi:MAG: SMC-Scp complex subunit ScpB [Candidatus Kerfeldbacteria bacterium]|nr:SMC-Scp complex subunit ScpB [Candidatus Kerfeldbacteria bacterium]